jgi:ribosomal protein S18 acetylase RimI-like enzyme
MPDLSSPETCFKPYENRPRRLIENPFLPTLKPEEPVKSAALASVRVAGDAGAPVGFCMLKGDELYQLYVSAQARGSGVAAALIADAETRLGGSGVATAWLACAIGNERAARFYEKCGWRRAGTVVEHLEIPNGAFPLEVWRYEKSLERPARPR